MPKRNLFFLLFIAIAFLIASGIPTNSLSSGQGGNSDSTLFAGRNVNMVSGHTWPGGDPWLQRQNEPSMAVSTRNPLHLLAGANDYRTVDMPESEGPLPGIIGTAAGDAWLGVFKSIDGGQSWSSELLPGYNNGPLSPLSGLDAASDPTVRAGIDGNFFYSGIAFNRGKNGRSVVFVAQYRDNNMPGTGDPFQYLGTTIIEEGTSGQFTDKPWVCADIPRPGYPKGLVYIVYSIFLGSLNQDFPSKIMLARSTDGGATWEAPIKLSESQQKNQGTSIAIDPIYGTVYVAWRRFATSSATDSILIAKSNDFGMTFTKAVEVAPIIYPFDQATIGTALAPAQFRTSAFPAMAIDDAGRIYLAWSEKLGVESRIVITSQGRESWDSPWPAPKIVESPAEQCHQFMPSLTFAAGRLMLTWFDNRYSARYYDEFRQPRENRTWGFSPTIIDGADSCPYRETVDVRTAEALPGSLMNFGPSIQVSRYIWVIDEETTTLRQAQFNPPCYQLFGGGEVPFHGDYIDIVPSPMFVYDGAWRFNTRDSDPFSFYVTWTDNRDVRPPQDNIWTTYTAPKPGCNSAFTGMRNQNIYCSKITRGIEVGVLDNDKPYSQDPCTFVIYVKNAMSSPDPSHPDPSLEKTLTLQIPEPSGDWGQASFQSLTESPLTQLTVSVPEHSSIVRQVFVQSNKAHTVGVNISDSGFSEVVLLNLVDGQSPGQEIIQAKLFSFDPINWSEDSALNPNIVNPNIVNPNIVNPNIVNPNIVNPNIVNLTVLNPNIVNPNIVNPNIVNPNIVNPNIVNPNIVNPNIVNATPGTIDNAIISDKVWKVKNEGNTVTAYTFKAIAGETLPTGTWIFAQLLIFKVHYTPAAVECTLWDEVHHELLVNIVNPNLISDTTGLDIKKLIGNPETINSAINNATFSLAPGEEALVILRIIDTNISKMSLIASGNDKSSQVSTLQDGGSIVENVAESYAESVGAVVVAHSSTESDPKGAVTLMILPDSLPSGKAGEPYPARELRAVGGTEPYSWSLTSGLLPFGMTFAGGVISGTPKESGTFAFTVQVSDASGETDTQQFSLVIAPPDPLTLTMTPEPAPAGLKFSFYGGPKFIASGGVQPYAWSLSGSPTNPNLLLVQQSDGTMKLQGTPQLAGEFSITVAVTDDYRPTPNSQPKTFTLCIMPLDLEIMSQPSPLADGFLGVPYKATLSVINAEKWPLDWQVTGLPPGLQLSNQAGNTIDITGTPEYETNTIYPKTYAVTVKVTDNFVMPTCGYTRIPCTKIFSIVFHPKPPVWTVEGEYSGAATAAAVDSEGSVYVTGYAVGASTGKDYYTVKYDKDGKKKWSVTYNGPGNRSDVPTSIAVDSSGVYVTGSSDGTTSGPDIYTAKYNSASGALLWEKRFDGPAHLGDGANGIVIRGGYVYVTGYVHRGNQIKHADYCTLKYTSSGTLLWEAKYESRRNGNDISTALIVDDSGNVYVTGKSQEGFNIGEQKTHDYLTVKYNSSGTLVWEVRDGGPGFGDDEPTAIALDSAGNVYVTGTTRGGTQGADYYTVKYGPNGSPLWGILGRNYDGGYGDDLAKGLALDGSGNVYVTGKSIRANGKSDFLTVKYDTNGVLSWAKLFGGDGDDGAVSIAFDSTSDGVFVAGFETSQNSGKDYLVLKYRSDGSIVWVAKYDGPSHKDDEPAAMALSSSGIFVTGSSDKGTQKVYLTLKFSK